MGIITASMFFSLNIDVKIVGAFTCDIGSAMQPKILVVDNMNYFFSLFLKFNDAEFIQYLKPVGLGPSGNTCPKCALQLEQ